MKPSALDVIDRRIADVEQQIDDLKARLEDLRRKRALLLSLPEICPSCGGTGQERYIDAAGSGDWRECLTCKGLGKIGPLKCRRCGRVFGTDMVYLRRYVGACPWCGGGLDYCKVEEKEKNKPDQDNGLTWGELIAVFRGD